MTAIEDGYGRYPSIPYHNNIHAADVLQAAYVLLLNPVFDGIFTDLEVCARFYSLLLLISQVFATIIAAAAHDVGHPGFSNQYMSATQSPLAILYNDKVFPSSVA